MNNYEFTAKNMTDVLEKINEVQFYLQHYNEDVETNNLRLNYLINEISDMVNNQLNANKYFYDEENKTSGE